MSLARWFAAFLVFGLLACDAEPTVVLGYVPAPSSPDAGLRMDAAAAGRAGGPGDPFREHECQEFEPVCGSDDMTYRNTCQALDAGVNVSHRGAC